ncbi:tyrosine-type recombinase/integrase [Shimia sp.]|uniref:tyrosine-type recombinase/integrase n=1 Tax=Shimia sp. TaxID=1954381 RepID=UPI003BAD29AA
MARPRGNRWQADAEYQGKRKRRSFPSKEEAEAWEAQVRLADVQGLPMPGEARADGQEAGSFKAFIDDNFNFLWGDKRSQETPKEILSNLCKDEFIGGDTPITSIDFSMLVKLVDKLSKGGNSGATINRKMDTLNKLLEHAKKLGVITEVPRTDRQKESKGRMRFFTKDEEKLMMSTFDHFGLIEAKHFTNFLLYTGARRREAYNFQFRDVLERSNAVSLWLTKAEDPRSLPITQPVADAIEYCMRRKDRDPTARMFEIEYKQYYNHWQRVREHLGFLDDPGFIPHTLRHTCASRLVQSGIDLRRVQTYMGHKSIQTTLRYAHLAPTDLEVAAKALEKF